MSRKRALWFCARTMLIVGGFGIFTGFLRHWMGYSISCEAIDDPVLAGLFIQIVYMVFGLIIGNSFPFVRKPDIKVDVKYVYMRQNPTLN